MDKNHQTFNESLENITSELLAADSIIEELDQIFYSAIDQNKSAQTYHTVSEQLSELSQSYQAIQKLLVNVNKPEQDKQLNRAQ